MRHVREFFVYSIPPIDLWMPLTTAEELELAYWRQEAPQSATLRRYLTPERIAISNRRLVEKLRMFVQCATAAVREANIGWEGDIREGPFVSFLPGDTEVILGILCFKQDNNGTTFIASIIPMPHLLQLE